MRIFFIYTFLIICLSGLLETEQQTPAPTDLPTPPPTFDPSEQPTIIPTTQPTFAPTLQPTFQPTIQPTALPTFTPTCQPTFIPTAQPSFTPTVTPTTQPSFTPTFTPTAQPSLVPTFTPTAIPTCQPTPSPTITPSVNPSAIPTLSPTCFPTFSPTFIPSALPTIAPSANPTITPSIAPTAIPTDSPSAVPSLAPTCTPTIIPTAEPTINPTIVPTAVPTTSAPSAIPSIAPSAVPTESPTYVPTAAPSTISPSAIPTAVPTTSAPSVIPTRMPSSSPSARPSDRPSSQPSCEPSAKPSSRPSGRPSGQPSGSPTSHPSTRPSGQPSVRPSTRPSGQPSERPSTRPSGQPSVRPSTRPSAQPSGRPSTRPSGQPSVRPSTRPSGQPSTRPSTRPSAQPSGRPSCQPTSEPTREPTSQPSSRPTRQPTSQPSSRPTRRPIVNPSSQPTSQPSQKPSSQPSTHPSGQPTRQPSQKPSSQPSTHPSGQPTRQPTEKPSSQPTNQPTSQPTWQPTVKPSSQPTTQPSSQPSRQPVAHPTSQPTSQPSSQPSKQPISKPSSQPTSQPTKQPSNQPTSQPSEQPSSQPSNQPSSQPSAQPSHQPSSQPSSKPSTQPSSQPSQQPSQQPSSQPSMQPSNQPSSKPTSQPTTTPTDQPILNPTSQPTSQPSTQPSAQPVLVPTSQPSSQPSGQPSAQPVLVPTSQPSNQPSTQPSAQPVLVPTSQPSNQPSGQPSAQPVLVPTSQPSSQPSDQPSAQPTTQPSLQPTSQPSFIPSSQPTSLPSCQPSSQPSQIPSSQPSTQPSGQPTLRPTSNPSGLPISHPTAQPSCQPTGQPTSQPTGIPTMQPSSQPSSEPSSQPTNKPSGQPSSQPSGKPSGQPTGKPSSHPTSQPTGQPSGQPSSQPSGKPTGQPTGRPSSRPTSQPTGQPSGQPSRQPTGEPSSQPSMQPSNQPSSEPSTQPTSQPSRQPTNQPSMQPSSIPTSQPTTFDSARVFECGAAMRCESNSFDNCEFYTGNVQFQCESNTTPCVLSVGSLLVGNDFTDPARHHTNLTMIGECDLVVNAQSTINILPDALIQATGVNFTAKGIITIGGKIVTSGRGPLGGPGVPTTEGDGVGASYGGSSGRLNCTLEPFSNIYSQIGTIDVLPDLHLPLTMNPTYGSGGGRNGTGRGGGRIILHSASVITFTSGALLNAAGTASNIPFGGAGSGGAVVIIGKQLVNNGMVSVKGGPATVLHDHLGRSHVVSAAGGGGRVSILLHDYQNISQPRFNIEGGFLPPPYLNYTKCALGGAGTIYFEEGGKYNTIYTFNAYDIPYATTPISFLPPKTNAFIAQSAVVLGLSIELPLFSSCTMKNDQIGLNNSYCSSIIFSNSTLYCSNTTTFGTTDSHRQSTMKEACRLQADIIRITNGSEGHIESSREFDVISKSFYLSASSMLSIDSVANISSVFNMLLFGQIISGTDEFNPNPQNTTCILTSQSSIHLTNIIVQKLIVIADNIIIPPGAQITVPDHIKADCIMNIPIELYTCSPLSLTAYKSLHSFQAKSTLLVGNNSILYAPMILACAPNTTIYSGATISASNLGCLSNLGPGGGVAGMVSQSKGSSGAGFGGLGGSGYNADNVEGGMYGNPTHLFSGSGGGAEGTWYGNNYGGGIISINATNRLSLYGNITSDGGGSAYMETTNQLFSGNGGGSGGTVVLYTNNFYGQGKISCSGGNGQPSTYPGGGGGGGFFRIYNHQNDYTKFHFYGPMVANGGFAGFQSSVSAMDEPSLLTSKVNSTGSGFTSFATEALTSLWSPAESASSSMLYGVSTSTSNGWKFSTLDFSAAQNGQPGEISLPPCPGGYGNDPTSGEICTTCPVGTFNTNGNTGSCIRCNNAPSHSSYTDATCGTSACPYQCDPGYSTDNCYNQIDKFFYSTLGIGGVAGVVIGLFSLLVVPLLYYRYSKLYDFEDKKTEITSDFFKRLIFADIGYGGDEYMQKHTSGRMKTFDKAVVENPLFASSKEKIEELDDEKVRHLHAIRKLQSKTNHFEKRREHRLGDADMIFHAYRINLVGTNHPLPWKGGQWMLPPNLPACLRPMIKPKKYAKFAYLLNQMVAWDCYISEALVYTIIAVFTPPLAALVIREHRRQKARVLLDFISSYDYSMFRCPKQRMSRNSLRIGISPDCSLAYIDFLFDEDHFSKSAKPWCPIGQTRLPAAFRLSGLGTYFSPYYIDTNDMLLQAIPQTDVTSAFIDEAWIAFVVELNTLLKTLQSDGLFHGLITVVKFLSEEKTTAKLGGLLVEFCTFDNTPPPMPDTMEDEDDGTSKVPPELVDIAMSKEGMEDMLRESAKGRPTSANLEGVKSIIASGINDPEYDFNMDEVYMQKDSFSMSSLPSKRTGPTSFRNTMGSGKVDENNVRERSDSDVDRFSRHSNENWFTGLQDVLAFKRGFLLDKSNGQSNRPRGSSFDTNPNPSMAGLPTTKDVKTSDPSTKKPSNQDSQRSSQQQGNPQANDHTVNGGTRKRGSTNSIFGFTRNTAAGRPLPIPRGFISWKNMITSYLRFRSWLLSFLWEVKDENINIDRPLDFAETCRAIQQGKLSLGIVVSHPKVMSDTYIIKEEDYEGFDTNDDCLLDDEADLFLNDTAQRLITTGMDKSDTSDEEGVSNSPKQSRSSKAIPIGNSLKENVNEDNTALAMSAGTAKLYSAYGSRAEEMSKFYRIMQAAEEQTQVQLSSSRKDTTPTKSAPSQQPPNSTGAKQNNTSNAAYGWGLSGKDINDHDMVDNPMYSAKHESFSSTGNMSDAELGSPKLEHTKLPLSTTSSAANNNTMEELSSPENSTQSERKLSIASDIGSPSSPNNIAMTRKAALRAKEREKRSSQSKGEGGGYFEFSRRGSVFPAAAVVDEEREETLGDRTRSRYFSNDPSSSIDRIDSLGTHKQRIRKSGEPTDLPKQLKDELFRFPERNEVEEEEEEDDGDDERDEDIVLDEEQYPEEEEEEEDDGVFDDEALYGRSASAILPAHLIESTTSSLHSRPTNLLSFSQSYSSHTPFNRSLAPSISSTTPGAPAGAGGGAGGAGVSFQLQESSPSFFNDSGAEEGHFSRNVSVDGTGTTTGGGTLPVSATGISLAAAAESVLAIRSRKNTIDISRVPSQPLNPARSSTRYRSNSQVSTGTTGSTGTDNPSPHGNTGMSKKRSTSGKITKKHKSKKSSANKHSILTLPPPIATGRLIISILPTNLAPSCYQQSVYAWRFDYASMNSGSIFYLPICDGRIGMATPRPLLPSTSSNSLKTSSAHHTPEKDRKVTGDVEGGTLSSDGITGNSTGNSTNNLTTLRTSMAAYHVRDSTYNVRDSVTEMADLHHYGHTDSLIARESIMPAFLQFNFSLPEYRTSESTMVTPTTNNTGIPTTGIIPTVVPSFLTSSTQTPSSGKAGSTFFPNLLGKSSAGNGNGNTGTGTGSSHGIPPTTPTGTPTTLIPTMNTGTSTATNTSASLAPTALTPTPISLIQANPNGSISFHAYLHQLLAIAICNDYYYYYLSRFLFGMNMFPYGPKSLRQPIELTLLVLCVGDICLWVIMLFNTLCASTDYTSCKDHTALITVSFIWPFAFFIAPLLGIASVVIGPSATLARVYALWTRLAGVNNAFMLYYTYRFLDYYISQPGSIYLILALTCSRIAQCFLVDLYIAHIERLRFTRGWDGLHTSLFKTKDNKKEIGI